MVSPFQYSGVPIQTFDIKNPWGVAFNHAGEIVVSAGDGVSVLGLNGTKIRSFGTRGSGPGQFRYSRGVAVDDEGNILDGNYTAFRSSLVMANSSHLRVPKVLDHCSFMAHWMLLLILTTRKCTLWTMRITAFKS